MSVQVRPIFRNDCGAFVAKHHSHHKRHRGRWVSLGAWLGGELWGVVVIARASARKLQEQGAFEITRLCVKTGAPHCTASKLLGHAWRLAKGAGIRRLVSYTRSDEPGTCYRAAGWHATVRTEAEDWSRSATRKGFTSWLPGMYTPSTETVARVRWEIGPDSLPPIPR